jgi:ADP-heptose:LPS heptosyltransferase
VPQVLTQQKSVQTMQAFLKEREAKAKRQRQKRLLIHPGTSLLALQKGIIKTWASAHWANLIERLVSQGEFEVILAGGPDDAAIIEEIMGYLANHPPMPLFFSAYGATKNLADLAALIELSDLIICVDSAPMHIAVALGKPVVALFGPTDHGKLLPPQAKFKPLVDDGFAEAENDGAATNGSVSGYQTGPVPSQAGRGGKHGLGVQLQPDAVYQAVLSQIEKVSNPKRSQGVGL